MALAQEPDRRPALAAEAHTATRCVPISAARIEHAQITCRHPVRVRDLQQRPKFGGAVVPQRRKFAVQPAHYPVAAPVGMICEIGHHAGAFVCFTDAFKGLDCAQAAQFGKAIALGLVVQQVAAENFDQIRLGDKKAKEPGKRNGISDNRSTSDARAPRALA